MESRTKTRQQKLLINGLEDHADDAGNVEP
jgi:hypothetical protein